jgi:hypothetical protein
MSNVTTFYRRLTPVTAVVGGTPTLVLSPGTFGTDFLGGLVYVPNDTNVGDTTRGVRLGQLPQQWRQPWHHSHAALA